MEGSAGSREELFAASDGHALYPAGINAPTTRLRRAAEPMVLPGEELLLGPGPSGGVVRHGDTVRRPPGRTPAGMIAVLRYLEEAGFDGAPRYRGKDKYGRHVFDYFEGEVALSPSPAWVTEDGLLASVARLLRRYHNVVGTTDWHGRRLDWGYPPPPSYQGSVPCHLDVSPANVVCRCGTATALIDFEQIALARPVWDLARTVRYWVPMLAPEDLSGPWRAVEGRHVERLALFLDAYELDRDGRHELADAMLTNADASHERLKRMRSEAVAGYLPWAPEWLTALAERNRRSRAWVAAMKAEITAGIR